MNNILETSVNIVLSNENKTFPVRLKEEIKQAVVVKLGVKNIFKLNDRLDGVYFLNKHLRRVLGSYIVEKSLGLSLLDDEKRLKCLTRIIVNKFSYEIVVTYDPESIKIPEILTDYFLAVFISNDYKKSRILGVIEYEECLRLSENSIKSNNNLVKGVIGVISEKNLNNIIYA